MDAPYLVIAAEIRRRVADGELRPGDRVPSTREITREWGVALATATKALAALRREGVVEALPRIGTVVAAGVPVRRREPELSRGRIVEVAVELADAEGLAALSMRGIAARLGVATMAPYRHVAGKDELVLLMIDHALGTVPLPDTAPPDWRTGLEVAARAQWAVYRRHPWLAHALSLTRPQLLPNAVAHSEWMLRSLDGLGLAPAVAFQVYVTVFNHVRGTAVNLEWEREAESASGLTDEQWMDTQSTALRAVLATGRFPAFARTVAGGVDLELDELFDFGLQRLLDGIGGHLAEQRGDGGAVDLPGPA
ncbi:TetR/AcrR family transcriptional regulator C-terminal domain-containing protein [Actinokineospora spheciospongiae]|uniref:TetR/AcrR family transcriptional regulator C-terminal domain-containing protein n=1 Tax=Actinokineospora spheciospongiae TaxID=909613 RepID=UPI000D719818|nr:TetR/AcrR family transcriptional regulator C-terminal domain-containing protein [Actinokineospora spheciospongiae]PWW64211.1 TetR family transcriptional regulator [Actinokineospora spheciospongiae]